LAAVIKGVRRYNWRPQLSEFGDALGGHDRARLEEYFEAVIMDAVNRKGGATGAETVFIGQVIIVGM
jgi:hypothetical protein